MHDFGTKKDNPNCLGEALFSPLQGWQLQKKILMTVYDPHFLFEFFFDVYKKLDKKISFLTEWQAILCDLIV